MLRWKTLAISAIGSLLLGAISLAPTQAQTGPEAEVEAVIDAMVAAWNAQDAEAFGALFTDEGIVAFAMSNGAPPETTAAEARASLAESIGDPPAELQDVRDIAVTGNTASATIVILLGGSLSADELEFTMVGGDWLVSDYIGNVEQVPPPAGYEGIAVEMFNYGYDIDTSGIAPGDDVAFLAENVGTEPHEIVMFKLPADLDLEEALASEEEPPVEFVGFTFATPGETAATLLLESATEGRYAMVCFIPAPDGTPHWELGMVNEFTIGDAAGTPTPTATATATATTTATATATATRTATPTTTAVSTPRPPATGGGADSGSSSALMLLVLGAGLLAAGGAFAVRTSRKP